MTDATDLPLRPIYGLDETESATILAALRFYQENGQGDPDNRSDEIHDIATNCGSVMSSLDDDGIDELCERLNLSEADGDGPQPGAEPTHSAAVTALRAIQARIQGRFDAPELVAFGPLGTVNDDCLRIAASALTDPQPLGRAA